MAEYIERETMIENIVQEALYYCYHDMNGESRGLMSAKELLQKAPAADVQPVRHGRWIDNKHTDTAICSECKCVFTDETNYCPKCGAKMKGEENG